MPYDATCGLWPRDDESFYRGAELRPIRQKGPHCVAAVLAMLTGTDPDRFQGRVNTQGPVSWSDALGPWGMKLAYCPTDARKIRFYMDGLLRLDDLFTLSYYTTLDPSEILGDPDSRGWVTGSHIVVLHRDRVLNPATGTSTDAREHSCNGRHAKRIFRVVPCDHPRGL